MKKLISVLLLLVGIAGFSAQALAKPITIIPQSQNQLPQNCLNNVDPVNPSPLTYTDRFILLTVCMQQDYNYNKADDDTSTLTYTDRYILYWSGN